MMIRKIRQFGDIITREIKSWVNDFLMDPRINPLMQLWE